MTVWRQHRRIDIGDSIEITDDLDTRIRVGRPRGESLVFDLRIWNLAPSTWARIEKGDTAVIELGWADGPRDVVTYGRIGKLERTPDGSDIEFRIVGLDVSDRRLLARVDGNWRNREPQNIARDLADVVGLSAVTDEVGRAIDWSIDSRSHRIRDGLDELTDYAAEYTDATWRAFADAGRLYFVRREQETIRVPSFRYGESLVSLSRTASPEEEVDRRFEFEAQLDPRITTGAVVHTDTELYSGPLRVDDYEFVSDTTRGTHVVRGSAVPAAESFRETRRVEQFQETFESFFEVFSS